MEVNDEPGRRYRGISTEERRAQRKKVLIEAAIQVYGQQGYQKATVKAVCAVAGLTERYFYESFANSEALLIASYNSVTFSLFADILRAAQGAGPDLRAQARAMLTTYFDALRQNPPSARMFLVEIRGVSPAVDDAFDASLRIIRLSLAQRVVDVRQRPGDLLLEGVLGGVIQIALRWIAQSYQPDLNDVTETALQLVSVLWLTSADTAS